MSQWSKNRHFSMWAPLHNVQSFTIILDFSIQKNLFESITNFFHIRQNYKHLKRAKCVMYSWKLLPLIEKKERNTFVKTPQHRAGIIC